MNRKQKVAKRKAEREAIKTETAFRESRDYNLDKAPTNVEENVFSEEIRDVSGGYLDPSAQTKTEPQNPVVPTTPQVTPEVPAPVEEKPKTLADYLAEMRKKTEEEKTSSVKMQKYHALTDALKALGDMGSTAVGGSIGGGAMDAPYNIAEYKPNRGYLEAIEKAKRADERLRALDDKGFQLAMRDEDRSFQQQMAKENRDFQRQMAELEAQRKEALAENDQKRAIELLEKKNQLQTEHDEKITKLKYEYETNLKNISKEIVRMQNSGEETDIPFTFHNMTTTNIPKRLYPEMLRWALSKGQIGEDYVDEDNVELVLRKHPEIVNSFLNVYGFGTKTKETPADEVQANGTTDRVDTASVSESTAFRRPVMDGPDWGISRDRIRATEDEILNQKDTNKTTSPTVGKKKDKAPSFNIFDYEEK